MTRLLPPEHDTSGIDYVMVYGAAHLLQFEEPQVRRNPLIGFLRRRGLN